MRLWDGQAPAGEGMSRQAAASQGEASMGRGASAPSEAEGEPVSARPAAKR